MSPGSKPAKYHHISVQHISLHDFTYSTLTKCHLRVSQCGLCASVLPEKCVESQNRFCIRQINALQIEINGIPFIKNSSSRLLTDEAMIFDAAGEFCLGFQLFVWTFYILYKPMFMYNAKIYSPTTPLANDIAMKSGIPYAETEQHFLNGMVRIKFSSAIPFSPCLRAVPSCARTCWNRTLLYAFTINKRLKDNIVERHCYGLFFSRSSLCRFCWVCATSSWRIHCTLENSGSTLADGWNSSRLLAFRRTIRRRRLLLHNHLDGLSCSVSVGRQKIRLLIDESGTKS